MFQQTGGTNTVSNLTIGSGGTYLLEGGALQVNNSLLNQGIFAGNGTPAMLSSNGILDLSSGVWENLGDISLSMDANSLLILPAGFDTSTAFAHYSSLGLTHTLGATLTVPAGQGFGGSVSITDPVNCQGTITAAAGGAINLSGGLTLSGAGTINLGNGNLTTNDLLSGISGGSLYVANHYVGNGGTGTFTQSGGNSSISGLSISATTPATAARTASVAAACSRPPPSTWAAPARGASRSRVGPTLSPTPSISVSTLAAMAPTASAACSRPPPST